MADLTSLLEGILSIAAVTVPIGLILALLVAGDYTVTDLFMAPSWDDRGHGQAPTDEEPAPRWRLERLGLHQQAPGGVANATARAPARSLRPFGPSRSTGSTAERRRPPLARRAIVRP